MAMKLILQTHFGPMGIPMQWDNVFRTLHWHHLDLLRRTSNLLRMAENISLRNAFLKLKQSNRQFDLLPVGSSLGGSGSGGSIGEYVGILVGEPGRFVGRSVVGLGVGGLKFLASHS